MREQQVVDPATVDRKSVRLGVAMAAIWLVFLAFPLWSLWADTGVSTLHRIVASLIVGAFVVVYLNGFARWTACQEEAQASAINDSFGTTPNGGAATGARVTPSSVAMWHLGVLIVLAVAGLVIDGSRLLGVLPYVVSYAVFVSPWRTSMPIFAVAVALGIVLPARSGSFGVFWFFTLIIVVVGVACVFIRLSEQRQIEQAALQSQLAVSDERSRVARDVHDVLGHSLTAVTLKAELCERLLDGRNGAPPDEAAIARARAELAELQTITRGAISEIRTTVGGLRTPELADELAAARAVLADAGVALTIVGEPADVPERYRSAVAWVVRESITNIVRHARASNAEIRFGAGGEFGVESGAGRAPTADAGVIPGLLVRVSDDGVGLRATSEGNGLRGLRERIDAMGGRLRTGSATDESSVAERQVAGGAVDGSGTRIEVVV